MNWLDILQYIGMAILGFATWYFRNSTKAADLLKQVANTLALIEKNVASFIDEAEELYKDATESGGKKFEYVVDKLYALIPSFLHDYISREEVAHLVQETFDAMEEYAKKQIDQRLKIEVKAETSEKK